jgi:glycosyltransferase involved in cell wall biosynthesis
VTVLSAIEAPIRPAEVDSPPGDVPDGATTEPLRVCVVGAGTRFLSGISYYTNRLINALGADHRVSAILIRQMMPTRLYPGRDRVGQALTHFEYPTGSRVVDGIDWYWGASIVRAIRLLSQERPDVLVLQWWTGTVLHSYLALAAAARRLGIPVVIEFHEVLDTAELGMPLASRYVRAAAPRLMAMADGFVVHNEHDRAALSRHYDIDGRPAAVVPHGPYDQYGQAPAPGASGATDAPDGVCRLLYFGVIRPFKGVEDIIDAFDLLSQEDAARFHLTVVGETWEGWTVPAQRIIESRHRDRITFVNRYVTDTEVAAFFAGADAVVLPYHRSSASGPLHLAMASGLPVIVSRVGGLIEASEGYEGAVMVAPRDPEGIRAALDVVYQLRGVRFADVHSWERTVSAFESLFCSIGAPAREA